jgi:hypothetical protein
MLCYKDKTWCTARDCVNMKCDRNTRNKEVFNPDEFWEKRIAYCDYAKDCKYYKKEVKNDSRNKI